MEKVTTVLQVIAPVFAAVILGVLARRTQALTPEQNQGLQQYVVKYGLPCVLFNSCLTAQIRAESVTTMALVAVLMIVSTVAAFRLCKRNYPYHNLPQLFAAQETGMLGIPLYIALFGSVDRETTWAVVLFAVLPASYLAPSLGRSQEDFTVASGVCSILTLVCLAAFCVIAAVVA